MNDRQFLLTRRISDKEIVLYNAALGTKVAMTLWRMIQNRQLSEHFQSWSWLFIADLSFSTFFLCDAHRGAVLLELLDLFRKTCAAVHKKASTVSSIYDCGWVMINDATRVPKNAGSMDYLIALLELVLHECTAKVVLQNGLSLKTRRGEHRWFSFTISLNSLHMIPHTSCWLVGIRPWRTAIFYQHGED